MVFSRPDSIASIRFYAREAILKHLDDLEDVYLTEKRMEAIESGRVNTVPLEDVMRQHGLEY